MAWMNPEPLTYGYMLAPQCPWIQAPGIAALQGVRTPRSCGNRQPDEEEGAEEEEEN